MWERAADFRHWQRRRRRMREGCRLKLDCQTEACREWASRSASSRLSGRRRAARSRGERRHESPADAAGDARNATVAPDIDTYAHIQLFVLVPKAYRVYSSSAHCAFSWTDSMCAGSLSPGASENPINRKQKPPLSRPFPLFNKPFTNFENFNVAKTNF